VDDRPRINIGLSLIAHGPGVVELRSGAWNARSVTLTDSNEPSRLLAVVERLDGTRTESEVAVESGASIDEVRAVIEQLDLNGVLDHGAITARDVHLDFVRTTLARRDDRGTEGTARPVLLLGTGSLADAVSDALTDVASVERPSSASWSRLNSVDFTNAGDEIDLARLEREFAEWKGHFLVVAAEVVNPIMLRNINWLAVRLDTPWSHAALDGPFALIGPTFVPRRSPCYDCFENRTSLTIREYASYVGFKRALAGGFVRQGQPRLSRPVQGILANLLAFEVSNYLLTDSAFTVGKVLAIYLPAFEFTFNEFLRMPSCRTCVGDLERSERQLHFDLRAYINSRRPANAG
jgi:bacteriocin biosynthesis cyclodehydratase domain-containing protein